MKDFLKSAEEQLKFNKDKHLVLTELGDHVETKKEFFESIGYDENASAEKANEAMGNGEIIGQRLNQIHRNKMEITLSTISIIALNIAAIFAATPIDKSTFFLPFLLALIVLIDNLFGTVLAIKRKAPGLSATLIAVSCTLMWVSMANLAYPLCNLIIARVHFTENFYTDYYFFRFLITAVLIAVIVAPNAYNIYHCKQMRQLKNTKKQNIIAGNLRNACVIAAVFCIVAAFPYYAMNDLLCEEQAELRDELIDFVFDTANKFEWNEKDELAEYLENCEYDFQHSVTHYSYNEFYDDVTYESFECYKGNWRIIFYFVSGNERYNGGYDNEYHVELTSIIKNSSEKYLCTTEEKENALIEILGDTRSLDDEELVNLPNSAIGASAEDIKRKMSGFNITSFYIDKYGDGRFADSEYTEYTDYAYYWIKGDELYLYNTYDSFYSNEYRFVFDDENACEWYSLSIFEKHEPVA